MTTWSCSTQMFAPFLFLCLLHSYAFPNNYQLLNIVRGSWIFKQNRGSHVLMSLYSNGKDEHTWTTIIGKWVVWRKITRRDIFELKHYGQRMKLSWEVKDLNEEIMKVNVLREEKAQPIPRTKRSTIVLDSKNCLNVD